MSEHNPTREELLSKLKSISLAVFMTVLPTEMCLEIETMTAEGTGFRWIGYDDWQVFELRKCEEGQWDRVLRGISEKALSLDDIANTDLVNLVYSIAPVLDGDPDLSLLFADLCKHDLSFGKVFFGFLDGKEMHFFSTRDDLKEALRAAHATVDSKWEDMDTSDLEYWWEKYKSNGDSLPIISFDNDE